VLPGLKRWSAVQIRQDAAVLKRRQASSPPIQFERHSRAPRAQSLRPRANRKDSEMQTEAQRIARMVVNGGRPVMPITTLAKLIKTSPVSATRYCRRFGIEIMEFSPKKKVIFEDQYPVLLERAAQQGAQPVNCSAA
jgi:hypothetical protein